MKKVFGKYRFPSLNHLTTGKKLNIVILYYAGKSYDDLDTLQSVRGIEAALIGLGHHVTKRQVTLKHWLKATSETGDVAFNLVEDDNWELYIKVGLRLERLGRAQIGLEKQGFLYVVSKARIKRRMKKIGIRTPRFRIMKRNGGIHLLRGLKYPLIVKPSAQHAGVGISQHSVVRNLAELEKQLVFVYKHHPGEIVVEEFIAGRELHVTVLGNSRKRMILPYCEIGYSGKYRKKWNIYTYNAKWNKRSWEYHDAHVRAPAPVSAQLQARIHRLTLKTYAAFGCRDVARLDIRVDKKEIPYVVDVNMSPSLNYFDKEDATIASMRAAKWTYKQLIETVVTAAYRRVNGNN
jgi:D-alanine-D-alanine ligase